MPRKPRKSTTPKKEKSVSPGAEREAGSRPIDLIMSDAIAVRPNIASTLGSRIDSTAFQPISNPQVVTVDGITGVFTPVTNKPDTPISADERKNLQMLIENLQKQVGELRNENITLTQQLEVLRNPPHSPEDFATAIQQSVDELQQKLTAMKNPVSSFALKEFRIDANVMIDVTQFGTIEYRFIRPDDTIDPNALSRITMDLVPIPKASLDHTWTMDLFQPGLGIEELPHITSEQSKTLETNSICTIGEFLQVGTRARAATQLVALLGVERAALSQWLQQAELLTLKGTNGATVLVLIAAGFNSLSAIAATTPEALLNAYLEKRKGMNQSGSVEATLEEANLWISASRRYLGTAG